MNGSVLSPAGRRLSTLLASLLLACSPPAAQADSPFVVDTLGPGVHVFRPAPEQPGWVNSLVVERDDGVLVVAAQPSTAAAVRLLAAIKAHIGKPVRFLVLPHSHADVAGGASAFPDEVLVIGTHGLREALEDPEYDFGAEARARSDRPAEWTEPARRSPTLLISAITDLGDSRNPVRLLPLNRVHSRGDLLVTLPELDLFFVGAIAFPDRAPYAEDARLDSWNSALNHLVREGPRITIPLRGGPVSVDELREERDALAWLSNETASALSERLQPDEIHQRIHETSAEHFDLDSPLFKPLVDVAIRQIEATRNRR